MNGGVDLEFDFLDSHELGGWDAEVLGQEVLVDRHEVAFDLIASEQTLDLLV